MLVSLPLHLLRKDETDASDTSSPRQQPTANGNDIALEQRANVKKKSQRVHSAGKMRREKSLSILSRKFIQMFLEGKVSNTLFARSLLRSILFLF